MSVAESVAWRLRSADFDRWLGGAAQVGFCANPVRLSGSSVTTDTKNGEVLGQFESMTQPDSVSYTRCGNRRAKRCESCSHEYKGDTWHMVMAGAAGGMKGVPDTVSDHPMVFLTLTAPSFGAVHSTVPSHRRGTCPHGKPLGCTCGHERDDPSLGDPLCVDCYNYTAHVVWQFFAPELWRRFTIQVRRSLARELGMTQSAASRVVRLQFAKVAEFQRRGAVHFHAIVRLDGVDENDGYAAPPADVSERQLVAAIRAAVRRVSFEAPLVPGAQSTRILRWGAQFDVQPIARRDGLDGALSDRAVAAYIAKYATKATEDLDGSAGGREHVRRIKGTAELIGSESESDGPYALLRKWSNMLGFRGHFSSKSRRYSVTLGSLRGARRAWRLEKALERYQALGHEIDEVLVIGSWRFAGMGWQSEGDRTLAIEAARAAREWRDARRVRFGNNEGENQHA